MTAAPTLHTPALPQHAPAPPRSTHPTPATHSPAAPRSGPVPQRPPQGARFLAGSITRHVAVMSATGAVGLIAVFVVDLLNLFYISLLGDPGLTAAVGFTGAVGYFQISVAIGMTIGLGAVVSRRIGAGRHDEARRIASASLVVMAGIMLALGLATVAALGPILDALGAHGEAHRQAWRYLAIAGPFLPLVVLGMACSALLRSVGDARRSMTIALAGAAVAAVLDPVLIFALHIGLAGAAVSAVISRATMALLGLHAVRRHGLLQRPHWPSVAADARQVARVATPAMLTNLATPVGSAYTTHAMAGFGLAAVAGQATVDRITPVAFGFVFALTGAVGPILSQNLGAGQLARVRQTLRSSLALVAACVLATWMLLALLQGPLIALFSATGAQAELIRLFCRWTAPGFVFVGALFVANAAFNNLGVPILATAFNWGRATLGTIPFVTVGLRYGPAGVLLGQAAGGVVFGLLALAAAFVVAGRLRTPAHQAPGTSPTVPGDTVEAALVELAQPVSGK